MSYQPPRHFAVQNKSTLVSDRDVAYWTEACRMQLRDHVCPAWGIDTPPGRPSTRRTRRSRRTRRWWRCSSTT
jgi:hypothetical protein